MTARTAIKSSASHSNWRLKNRHARFTEQLSPSAFNGLAQIAHVPMPFNAERNESRPEPSDQPTSQHAVTERPRIAIFTRSYPPAHSAGGPARSLYALVEALGSEFAFSVITSAHVCSTTPPKQSLINLDQWSTYGQAAIWHESGRDMPSRTASKLMKEINPDLIYLNSLFDYRFALCPLLIARLKFRKTPVILAPRGELSAGALMLKRQKKRIFIAAFRLLRLHRSLIWHASTVREKSDIERVFGSKIESHIALDLRKGLFDDQAQYDRAQKAPHVKKGCSLVFLSRIVPKKNVAALIEAMLLVRANARLSIAGPIEDAGYWDDCLGLIRTIPDAGMINYVGCIPADQVVSFLGGFDLFVLPTLGENFGHVILESLAAGTPVIVGSDTPWGLVETSGAGWVCNPTDPQGIAELIERFLSMSADHRQVMRTAALDLAQKMSSDPRPVIASRAMLRSISSNRFS